MNLIKTIATFILMVSAFLSTASCAQDDEIVNFDLDNLIIGLEEKPVVRIELSLSKLRDLYVAVQEVESRKTVKSTMKRIKKSGNYHFSIDIDDIKPGKYRVNAYLAPKGKNWNDRLGDTKFKVITVIDAPKAPEPSVYSKKDLIKKVTWPKTIIDDSEVILTAKYDITENRDLHLKLLDSSNWKELGALKYTVKKPGEISVPFSDLVTNFPAGKYVWVVYLTAIDSDEALTKKQGKHFVIGAK
ncbi:hypothetical protein Q4575_10955 [Psychrosphaera sp. 1_MG-2023]|uniref:hypothetical protein n=1 Tax=Psychrosphaera sp. 1_MG-2023 TaxID=3062643 RepID=UPI0026E37239|nr:hypothetical protein [Psychrosphaera sp. 1_MG-2023]MDO6719924.1 hypothetical protein [Psychrosphaera sp. 1_MG-2023]